MAEKTPPIEAAKAIRLAQELRAATLTDAALDVLRNVRSWYPDESSAFCLAASILMGRGDLVEAETLLSAALERHSQDMGVTMLRGYLARKRGDSVEAKRRWEIARTLFPKVADGY